MTISNADELRELMAIEGDAIGENTGGFNAGQYESVARLDDYEELKEEARAIKADAIERLPELVDELRETVEANDGMVYIADDTTDANRYIRDVVAPFYSVDVPQAAFEVFLNSETCESVFTFAD